MKNDTCNCSNMKSKKEQKLIMPSVKVVDASHTTKEKADQKSIQLNEKEINDIVGAQDTKQLKQRVTIHISVDLIDRVKNAVYWEPGLTLTEFAEQAFSKALDKREKDKGGSYPARKDKQLKGGRPIS